jgi:hypothetical protein
MPSLRDYFKIKKTDDADKNNTGQSTLLTPGGAAADVDLVNWTYPEGGSTGGPTSSESSVPRSPTDPLYMKSVISANWLYSKQESKMWTTGLPGEGVVLRMAKGRYICCPPEIESDGSDFYQMIVQLNVQVRIPTACVPSLTRAGRYDCYHQSD